MIGIFLKMNRKPPDYGENDMFFTTTFAKNRDDCRKKEKFMNRLLKIATQLYNDGLVQKHGSKLCSDLAKILCFMPPPRESMPVYQE
jgi:hypothetical protein